MSSYRATDRGVSFERAAGQGFQLQLAQGRDNIGPERYTRLLDPERRRDLILRSEKSDCIFLEHTPIIADAIEMSIAHAIKLRRSLRDMGAATADGRRSRRVPDPKTLGGRVQILREQRGWSQAALAKEAGMSQPTLANIERGKTSGGYAVTVAQLAKALNVNVEWLRTGKGDPVRHLDAATPSEEAAVIYNALPPHLRDAWMASGRALLNSIPRKK